MKDRHPDLFSGYCLTYRQNIILGIADIALRYEEILQFLHTDRHNELMNKGVEAEEGELNGLIEHLKTRGYNWK